jgi:acyl-[acyl-carrier-protein]-phospholipid O-acyltransferase/long-chain-fatty-acid--[acyl-carrier-protein] ligase
MVGYLDDPDREARELHDGWYVSGDLASLDDEGFIALTGRLLRVSQIDGERVSHGAVEDAICYELGTADSPVAVSARGDDLVVFYRRGTLDPERVVTGLARRGLPPAWCPRLENFVPVEDIPLLPAGTVDYVALQRALDGAQGNGDGAA